MDNGSHQQSSGEEKNWNEDYLRQCNPKFKTEHFGNIVNIY